MFHVIFVGHNSSSTLFKIPWKSIISDFFFLNIYQQNSQDYSSFFHWINFRSLMGLQSYYWFLTLRIRWEGTNHVLLSFCRAIAFQPWLRVVCFPNVLPQGERSGCGRAAPGALHKDVRAGRKIQCGKRKIKLWRELSPPPVFVWLGDFSPPWKQIHHSAGAV